MSKQKLTTEQRKSVDFLMKGEDVLMNEVTMASNKQELGMFDNNGVEESIQTAVLKI